MQLSIHFNLTPCGEVAGGAWRDGSAIKRPILSPLTRTYHRRGLQLGALASFGDAARHQRADQKVDRWAVLSHQKDELAFPKHPRPVPTNVIQRVAKRRRRIQHRLTAGGTEGTNLELGQTKPNRNPSKGRGGTRVTISCRCYYSHPFTRGAASCFGLVWRTQDFSSILP